MAKAAIHKYSCNDGTVYDKTGRKNLQIDQVRDELVIRFRVRFEVCQISFMKSKTITQ